MHAVHTDRHADTRTARQLARDYSRAKSQERHATNRADMQRAHELAAEIWHEARARAGKDWAVFSRIVKES